MATATAPSSTGLKGQWGVGHPGGPTGQATPGAPDARPQGSDKQANDFKAAFEKEQGAINAHLQYTSAHAEASAHDAMASRRDALYGAFQSALGKIDRTDPGKARGAIDGVLADARALSSEAATLHRDTEEAKNDWDSRQASYDEAVTRIEELEAWEDGQAPALRGQADAALAKTNERRWREACTDLEALLAALEPVYEEYVRQRDAKPLYEQQLAEQSARLESLKAAERPSQPMTAKSGEADAALADATGKADARDFVGALEGMTQVKALVDELDTLANDPQRQQYLADSQNLEQASALQPEPAFSTLDADWLAIAEAAAQTQPLADAGDYAGANQAIADSKAKRDEFDRRHAELLQARTEYEALAAELDGQLEELAGFEFQSLQAQKDGVAASRQAMADLAANEDFAGATAAAHSLAEEMRTLVEEARSLEEKRAAYQSAADSAHARLAEAAAQPPYKANESLRDELNSIGTAMEDAARSEDYDGAAAMAADLETKATTYLAEHRKVADAEQAFRTAWAPVKAKVGDATLTSRAFKAIDADRQLLVSGQADVEAAASAQDFDKAAQLVAPLEQKADAYLAAAKVKEDQVKQKADDITKQLDEAGYFGRDEVAAALAKSLTEEEVKALPTDVRNRLMEELHSGFFGDDEKEACKNLYSQRALDPEFEKLDDARREQLIDKMKKDPDFKKARDNWATLSEAERVAALKKAADCQAEAYGIPVTDVEAYSPENDDGTPDLSLYGEYNHSDGTLKISREMMQSQGFDQALDTLVHENGHRYQATLADRLESGDLKPGDPEYEQARTFALNDKFYVQAKDKKTDPATPDTGDEYFTQPEEAHSRETGEGIAEAGIGK